MASTSVPGPGVCWGLILLLPACAGCGGASLPPLADADQARAMLRIALDTWQKGESVEALGQRSPPVYFNDPRPQAGVQLVAYKMDDTHGFHGQSVRQPVVLSLKAKDGTTRDRKTAYLIDTSPAIVIVPE